MSRAKDPGAPRNGVGPQDPYINWHILCQKRCQDVPEEGTSLRLPNVTKYVMGSSSMDDDPI